MAEWVPYFKVTGGLYNGYTPDGNLSGFMDILDPIVSGLALLGSTDKVTIPPEPPDAWKWQGAFGQSKDAMVRYGNQHMDQGGQTVILQIFSVPNPPNVQYYKQELVVEGGIRAIDEEGGYPGTSNYYHVHMYDMAVTRIYRREYATPYSTPTVTHEFITGVAYGASNIRVLLAADVDANPGIINENFKFATSYHTKDGVKYLCWCFYAVGENTGHWKYFHFATIGISLPVLNAAFGAFKLDEEDDPNIPDPDDPGQDPPPEPGEREPEYDPIPIPGMPDLDAIGVGFITLYTPSKAILNLLADEIFSTNILDIIKNYFASVQELIAGLTILPFFVPSAGYAHHKIGLFESSVAMPVVANQFIEVDCGSVEIKKYFNNFLDYAGNTRIYLWLPYIGYQEINPDEVMGNTISIKYHCDVLSGARVAFVMIGTGGSAADTNRVIAQYSGNVLTQVPVAEQSFNSQVSNAINILTASVGIAAGAAIGGAAVGAAAGTSSTALVPVGAAGAAGSAAGSAAGASGMGAAERAAMAGVIGSHANKGMSGTTANAVMGKKPTFSRNGTPGSTAGYMSVQKPYLIKIVPRDAVAKTHNQLNGYPSDFGGTLSGLTGYCEVEEIQLNGVSATESEFKEIYNLLKGGVVI